MQSLWMLVASLLFACMGVCVKLAAETHSAVEITFYRSFISLIIMFNMVLGSLSPAVVGAISDALKPRPDGLMLAMTATSTTALMLAAGLMLLCGRGYVQTTRAARAVDPRDDRRAGRRRSR